MAIKASKQQIANYIAVCYIKQDLYNKVREVLVKFDGKKITKALATAVEKEFPALSVYYGDAYKLWYLLSVWGGAVKYDKRLEIQLGYLSEGKVFSLKRFDELNIRNTKYVQWAEEAKKDLDNYDKLQADFLKAEQVFLEAENKLGALKYDLSGY